MSGCFVTNIHYNRALKGWRTSATLELIFAADPGGDIPMPDLLDAKIRELNLRSEPFISVKKLIPN